MEYLLDDNKFYLKECSLIKDNELKVIQCNNLSQTKISKLKEMGYEVDFSYDIFLNYLYNTSKISSISKDDMQLKEGRYPLRYNEIIVLEIKILGEGKYGTYYYRFFDLNYTGRSKRIRH